MHHACRDMRRYGFACALAMVEGHQDGSDLCRILIVFLGQFNEVVKTL
jgi:hypothetical protein